MFKEIPATKHSINQRKLVYGVGLNDARYMISFEGYKCPFYSKWKAMLRICYSEKEHIRHPYYKDCSTCDDWQIFSKLKYWMQNQDWHGKELDKDLIKHGNKIYSPEFCIFVEGSINKLIGNNKEKRLYPAGVCFKKSKNKFVSQYTKNGIKKHLGYFDNPIGAHKAYCEFKSNHIIEVAQDYKEDKRLFDALIRNAERIASLPYL